MIEGKGYSSRAEGLRVRMIHCIKPEQDSPTDLTELELWCAKGYSVQSAQTHTGDNGFVSWITESRNVCVAFDDGNERVLYPEEIDLKQQVLVRFDGRRWNLSTPPSSPV